MQNEENKENNSSSDQEASERKQNFGSWREKLDETSEQRAGSREQEAGSSEPKPVDGMGHFVSKEGFVVDDGEQQRAGSREQGAGSREQGADDSQPSTPPPPKPQPPPQPIPKPGFPRWLKVLILAILTILILFILYILFLYKSTLELSVSQTGAKVTLDNKAATDGINKVRPGTYVLKVEKEGFVPYSKEVKINYFRKSSLSIVLKEISKIITIYDGEANYLAYNQEYDLYLFYVPSEAAIFRLAADKVGENKETPLLTTPHYLKNVVDIIWNPDRLTAILKIKNERAILNDTPFSNSAVAEGEIMTYLYDFGRYDLLHQETKFWDTGIGDLEFTPKGDQVAYFFEPGTGEKSLVIANKDNSSINRILDLRSFANPTLSWASDLKNIVLVNKSTDYPTNKIYIFNLIEKTLSPVTDSGNNIAALFDPEGKLIVYSSYSSDPDFTNYSLLSMMDKDGQNKKELKVRSYLTQISFDSSDAFLALVENEKDKYLPVAIELSTLKKTEYTFSGEIVAPISFEYIEAKNSIIFVDGNKPKLLFLTTKEYE